jgi:hypothetical protein
VFGYLFNAAGNLFVTLGDLAVRYRIEGIVFSLCSAFLLFLSFGFYRLRCRHRSIYACSELAFGAASILFANQSLLQSLTGSNSIPPHVGLDAVISLLAGLYIIIRGHNNLEESLGMMPGRPPIRRFHQFWLSAFYRSWRRQTKKRGYPSRRVSDSATSSIPHLRLNRNTPRSCR